MIISHPMTSPSSWHCKQFIIHAMSSILFIRGGRSWRCFAPKICVAFGVVFALNHGKSDTIFAAYDIWMYCASVGFITASLPLAVMNDSYESRAEHTRMRVMKELMQAIRAYREASKGEDSAALELAPAPLRIAMGELVVKAIDQFDVTMDLGRPFY